MKNNNDTLLKVFMYVISFTSTTLCALSVGYLLTQKDKDNKGTIIRLICLSTLFIVINLVFEIIEGTSYMTSDFESYFLPYIIKPVIYALCIVWEIASRRNTIEAAPKQVATKKA